MNTTQYLADTLKLSNPSYNNLDKRFEEYIFNIEKYFGKVQYLRVYDLYRGCDRPHIHVLIRFNRLIKIYQDNYIPSREFLEMCKAWKYGSNYPLYPYNIRGWVSYILKNQRHYSKGMKDIYGYDCVKQTLNWSI